MLASNILQDRDKAKLLLLVTAGDALEPLTLLQAAVEASVPENAAHVPRVWVVAKDRVTRRRSSVQMAIATWTTSPVTRPNSNLSNITKML